MSKRIITNWILFILYSAVMMWLLFGQRLDTVSYRSYLGQLSENINLIPFKTVAEYISTYSSSDNSYLVRHAYINLAGNVIVFIPLGIFLPMLWEKLRRAKGFYICITAVIISVEVLQYFTLLGSLDIDDLILNIAGASIGFLIYKLAAKLLN